MAINNLVNYAEPALDRCVQWDCDVCCGRAWTESDVPPPGWEYRTTQGSEVLAMQCFIRCPRHNPYATQGEVNDWMRMREERRIVSSDERHTIQDDAGATGP